MLVFSLNEFIWWLVDQFILGDFKWTLLGAFLLGIGMLLYALIYVVLKGRYTVARVILGFAFIILIIYFGHELVDPYFHMLEKWYITPSGSHMDLSSLLQLRI